VMHGHEKSDPSIVAMKPANKGGRLSAELVEPRGGAEGNAIEHDMRRTPSRESMTHGLDRVRQAVSVRFAVKYPRWEPYAGNLHVRFCAGGAP
jgi:RNA-directed DNA polymerase